MSARLEDGYYKDRHEFEADFKLMMENARTYNPAGSFVHNESLEFEKFFEKRMFASFVTLSSLTFSSS